MNEENKVKPKAGIPEKLFTYALNNPFFTLWNLAAIIGGLVGYLHYQEISYFPEIDIKSAGTVLIALALTGTGLTVLLIVVFIVPAFYFRLALWDEPQPVALDTEMDSIELAESQKRRRVGKVILQSAVLAVGAWCIFIWALDEDRFLMPDIWIGLIGLFLILTTILFAKLPKKSVVAKSNEQESYLSRLPKKYIDLFLSIFIWFISFGLVGLLIAPSIFANKSLSFIEKLFWTCAFLASVAVSNGVLTTAGKRKGMRYAPLLFASFAIAPVILFILIPGNSFSLTKAAVGKLGLGNMENSFFLVKKEACDALNLVRKSTCIPVKDLSNTQGVPSTNGIGCVRPKYLENKLGNEYLLSYEALAADKTNTSNQIQKHIYIPLKKEDVIVWSFGDTSLSGGEQCSLASSK